MPFSFKDNWVRCDGASSCPCPNHLGPEWRLPLVFPDTINDHPSLRHVANGNECPTSDDEDVINKSIPALEAQLQTTMAASEKLMRLQTATRFELFKIEREVEDMLAHQRKLSRALRRRKKIKAPIRRLPVEILTHIFLIAVLPFPSTMRFPRIPDEDIELAILTRVCRKWSRVVFKSPILWRRLSFKVNRSRFQSNDAPEVVSFLRRVKYSAQMDLHVELTCERLDDYYNKRSELPPILLSLLERICPRIRYLGLRLSSLMIHSLYPLRGSFNSLDEVYTYQGRTGIVPIELFNEAPKLVVYETNDGVSNSVGIPWNQLQRHSALFCANIDVVFESLEAATNLRVGIYSFTDASQTPLRPVLDAITCTSLLYLKVYVGRSAHLDKNAHPLRQLFAQCVFPALRRLHVGTDGTWSPKRERDTPETFHAILLCLQRSGCQLTKFTYDHGPVAPADVCEFFRTQHSLSWILLSGISSGLNDEALESLWVRPGQADVWAPNLTSLVLEGDLEFDAVNFAAMVDSRWCVAPLSRIHVHWHDVHDKPRDDYSSDSESDSDDDADLKAKKARWGSEGAILEQEFEDLEDLGLDLYICTEGCESLVENLDESK
ncbi:hypothetical protein CPB85DRAFT_1564101 [Mucidula mucida]|nr:hypothetical protein CPB85DRAFT_1564101 [Mucidula mucida]